MLTIDMPLTVKKIHAPRCRAQDGE